MAEWIFIFVWTHPLNGNTTFDQVICRKFPHLSLQLSQLGGGNGYKPARVLVNSVENLFLCLQNLHADKAGQTNSKSFSFLWKIFDLDLDLDD